MPELNDIREALKVNLDAIAGVQVNAYALGNSTPPTIEIVPGEITYDQAMQRGLDRWRFTVYAFVGLTTDIGAQKRLGRMLDSSGPDSVKQAIEADAALGGLVDDLHVVSCSGQRQYEVGSGRVLVGAEWTVDVLASG